MKNLHISETQANIKTCEVNMREDTVLFSDLLQQYKRQLVILNQQ